jgi:hypothetical protein
MRHIYSAYNISVAIGNRYRTIVGIESKVGIIGNSKCKIYVGLGYALSYLSAQRASLKYIVQIGYPTVTFVRHGVNPSPYQLSVGINGNAIPPYGQLSAHKQGG